MFKLIAAATAAFVVATAPVSAAEWAVDHGASTLTFKVRQGEKVVSGSFATWDAAIDFDPQAPETASIKVTVDTASVETADGQMGKTLTGGAWLAAGDHPEATFASDEVVKTGDSSFDAVGTLTIKGISVPMTLPFTLQIDGETAKAHGGSSLDRLDYKIGSEIDANTLDDAVKVEFDLAATKK